VAVATGAVIMTATLAVVCVIGAATAIVVALVSAVRWDQEAQIEAPVVPAAIVALVSDLQSAAGSQL